MISRKTILAALVLACLAGGAGRAAPADEIEALRKAVEKLQAELRDRQKLILDLEKQNTELTRLALAKQTELAAVTERLQRVTEQLEQLSREVARLQGKQAEPGKNAANPPAEPVRTVVKAVNDGLMTIAAGSDAGLQRGHTLEVYRLKPKPEYLGRLVIVDVRPNEAIGKLMGPAKQPIQVGDEVTSILPEKK